jgi:PRTRC genetic system protein B
MTDLKGLCLEEQSGQCALAVYVTDVQCVELQEPILRLEAKHPKVGRYVWRALHRGLGLLGEYCTPDLLLYLLGMYYWQGEEDESAALEELKAQGEDVSQIEMVRRSEVDRQFPKWILNLEKFSDRAPRRLQRLPFAKTVERLMSFEPNQLARPALESQSIPLIYVPWENSIMGQVADEHFNLLNQNYETLQFLALFDPDSRESFTGALKQFRVYLEVLQAVEQLLDALLGAGDSRPVTIGTPKESPSELAATHALLLYNGNSTSNRGMVTVHSIARGPGRYVLLPGKPASAAALYRLIAHFNPSIACTELLPEHLLRHNANELLWHCPSRVTPIFFQTNQEELNAISGKPVRHPHLLFHVVDRNLYVAALPDEQRPSAETLLMRAPYYNVSSEGQVCQGSMSTPSGHRPGVIEHWEKAFFKSAFTHAHGGAFQLTTHPRGHAGLWIEQTGNSHSPFPIEHLVPTKLTVRQWLNSHLS